MPGKAGAPRQFCDRAGCGHERATHFERTGLCNVAYCKCPKFKEIAGQAAAVAVVSETTTVVAKKTTKKRSPLKKRA